MLIPCSIWLLLAVEVVRLRGVEAVPVVSEQVQVYQYPPELHTQLLLVLVEVLAKILVVTLSLVTLLLQ